MQEILAEWADDEGNEYVLLSDPPDDGHDPRNARRPRPANPASMGGLNGRIARRPPRPQHGPQGAPPPRHPTSPAPSHTPQPTRPQVHIVQAPGTIRIQTGKVLKFVEVLGETVAELIPLPELPPTPTGSADVDLQNQNEHRQALHAHRVLTSRIRTGGRVVTKIIRLLTEE